jgi:hypothetical protein
MAFWNLNPSRINPNFLGKKHTEETKRKISEAKKGKKLSLQTINNIKESFRINGHPIKKILNGFIKIILIN